MTSFGIISVNKFAFSRKMDPDTDFEEYFKEKTRRYRITKNNHVALFFVKIRLSSPFPQKTCTQKRIYKY